MSARIDGGRLLAGTIDLAVLDELHPGAVAAVTRCEAAVLCGLEVLVVELSDPGWRMLAASPALGDPDVDKRIATADGRELLHVETRIAGERDEQGEPVARARLVFTAGAVRRER